MLYLIKGSLNLVLMLEAIILEFSKSQDKNALHLKFKFLNLNSSLKADWHFLLIQYSK